MAIINGTPGDDNLIGTSGDDTISGGAGIDTLSGDGGNDILDGGPGYDTATFVEYSGTGTLQINLLTGTATGPSGSDTLTNIEHILAFGNINTTIIGDNNGDVLEAMSSAANTITGGAGNDVITDRGHASTLDGGGGSNGVRLLRDQNPDGSAATTPVTQSFTPGVAGTLADGTSYANFDYFFLLSGNGDDTVTFNQPKAQPALTGSPIPVPANEWNASGGNDTAIVNLSSYSNQLVMFQTPTSGAYSIDVENGSGQGTFIISFLDVENFQITGGSGDDLLTTGTGNDILTGSAGNDTLDGGTGSDIARYSGLASNYRVDQLSATSFRVTDLRAGSPDGTDTLNNIEKLQWGDNSITKLINSPPTVITNSVFGTRNQTYTLASLASVSDGDGDAITRYEIYDGNSDPNSGHFLLNGQALPERAVIDLTASQFAQVSFISGKVNDQLQVRAFDGQAWSAADSAPWAPFAVVVPANNPPQVQTFNKRLIPGQFINASSLLSVSDADGDPVTLYQLYDGNNDPNSGEFRLAGASLPSRQIITLTPAQFAQTTFVASGYNINDDLQIRVFDGVDWSAADNASWAPFTAGPSADNLPVLSSATTINTTAGLTYPLPGNITITDRDNDTISRYQLYDDNADPNSGHFLVNGQIQAKRTVIDLSPAQYAQASFVTGAHSDTIEVRAFDGYAWSAADSAPWNPITMQLPANHAPVLTTTNHRVPAGQPLALSSLVTVSDADGDAMVRYQLYDGNDDPGSGYFVLNSQALPSRTVLDLTAAQAAQVSYVPGTVTDNLQVRVFDGQAWSAADNAAWAPFGIGQYFNSPPVVSTGSLAAGRNQVIALSSLFSVSDADSDAMTRYQLYENSGNSTHAGFFMVNNVAQPWRTVIDITAAQLAQTSFATGTDSVELQIRAFDGISWSAADNAAWAPFTITVPANNPPVVHTQNVHVAAGQTIALSSFLVTDADGDPITRYQLYDNTNAPNSGHFMINGQAQSANIVLDVTAAQAVQTSFVTGTVNDDLQIRAYDGKDWSAADNANWAPFTIGPANQPPTLTTANKRVAAGQTVTLASLASIFDPDADAMTRYQLYDGTSDPNSGHFAVNGQVQASRVVIDLTAAQAAQTSFVTGTVNDDLQIRVSDGQVWSAADSANWAPFTIGPSANNPPVLTTGTVNTTPGQTLSLASLISISDADGDAMTRYQLYDDSSNLNSGHFTINGVAQPSRQVIDITAAQASQTSFVSGAVGDSLQIRAFDGRAWSAADSASWSPFLVTVS